MLRLKDRERIVFAGDSVTDAGRAYPVGDGPNGLGSGFVRAIDTMLNAFYPQFMFDIINAGINGNTTRDLLARWDRDVMALKPDRLVICIGINDVWRQFDYPCNPDRHVLPEEYEANMRKLIESAKESVPEILLLTPYYMEPNAADTMRARMDEYGAIVKRLAKEYSLPCIDLQPVFSEYLANRHSAYLMWDRVHPGPVGSMLIAGKILKEFGFDKNITE